MFYISFNLIAFKRLMVVVKDQIEWNDNQINKCIINLR